VSALAINTHAPLDGLPRQGAARVHAAELSRLKRHVFEGTPITEAAIFLVLTVNSRAEDGVVT
jgi:hypothetical protein